MATTTKTSAKSASKPSAKKSSAKKMTKKEQAAAAKAKAQKAQEPQMLKILRNDAYFVLLFQLRQELVRMIWLHIQQIPPPLIVESQHLSPVLAVALN